jgi:hypothetical protein
VSVSSTWDAARDFFAGREPTMGSAIGAAELTLAALAIALLAWPVAWLAASLLRRRPRPRARTLAGAVVLAAGLALLAAGVAHHHSAATVILGGGSEREAGQQVAR